MKLVMSVSPDTDTLACMRKNGVTSIFIGTCIIVFFGVQEYAEVKHEELSRELLEMLPRIDESPTTRKKFIKEVVQIGREKYDRGQHN